RRGAEPAGLVAVRHALALEVLAVHRLGPGEGVGRRAGAARAAAVAGAAPGERVDLAGLGVVGDRRDGRARAPRARAVGVGGALVLRVLGLAVQRAPGVGLLGAVRALREAAGLGDHVGGDDVRLAVAVGVLARGRGHVVEPAGHTAGARGPHAVRVAVPVERALGRAVRPRLTRPGHRPVQVRLGLRAPGRAAARAVGVGDDLAGVGLELAADDGGAPPGGARALRDGGRADRAVRAGDGGVRLRALRTGPALDGAPGADDQRRRDRVALLVEARLVERHHPDGRAAARARAAAAHGAIAGQLPAPE